GDVLLHQCLDLLLHLSTVLLDASSDLLLDCLENLVGDLCGNLADLNLDDLVGVLQLFDHLVADNLASVLERDPLCHSLVLRTKEAPEGELVICEYGKGTILSGLPNLICEDDVNHQHHEDDGQEPDGNAGAVVGMRMKLA